MRSYAVGMVLRKPITLWRSKFGGRSVPDAKRLKELEAENTRLKKLLAEPLLEIKATGEAPEKSSEHPSMPSRGALYVIA